MQQSKEAKKSRKEDARRKIMMGGLIIKAGLGHMHEQTPHAIYGMLIHCRHMLQAEPKTKEYFAQLGKELMVK